jgi:hypothetical protein
LSENVNIKYEWKINHKWNAISFLCATEKHKIEQNSIEEFIFERYFGFTKLDKNNSQEFRINHPKWLTQKIIKCDINCDFTAMYGSSFAGLNQQKPDSILFANGSSVSVNWKRNKF